MSANNRRRRMVGPTSHEWVSKANADDDVASKANTVSAAATLMPMKEDPEPDIDGGELKETQKESPSPLRRTTATRSRKRRVRSATKESAIVSPAVLPPQRLMNPARSKRHNDLQSMAMTRMGDHPTSNLNVVAQGIDLLTMTFHSR
uniref:Uncharacterized protein n=1 Tax=Grammatophora oceanica TaxID=210454 RepID=A0A7S1V7V1_9STRA|mmetsp:Transcript_39002/g.57986  ORF Transcript_39002/g.57986 Transcript_39002/m.57986 type:complete len:147 (+) Transcript_39002:221-661(+)